MKKITFMVITLFLYSYKLIAGTIDPNTTDEKYLTYGAKFQNVVKLCCYDKENRMCCGSAVIIDSHWILTAAHVVNECNNHCIYLKEQKYLLDNVISHPDYKPTIFGYNDLALGYIVEDAGLDFYPDLYENQDESGKICSIAGYGITGNFVTGANISDGKKRAGSNIIDHIEKQVLICSPSRQGKNKTELEFLISNGDSGGGLFIDKKLAGINSAIMCSDKKLDSSYGDESCHTRISVYRNWILETITKYKNIKK